MTRATLIKPCVNVLQHASSKGSLASLHAATVKQTCHIYIQDLVADTENKLPSQVQLCDSQTSSMICGEFDVACTYLS